MLICNKFLIRCTECFPLPHPSCIPAITTTSCNTEEDILYILYKPKVGVRTPFPKWSDNEHQTWKKTKIKQVGRRGILIYVGFLSTINVDKINLLCFYNSGYNCIHETVALSTQRSGFYFLDKAF